VHAGRLLSFGYHVEVRTIHIDQYLTWGEHNQIISNKIAKNIGNIRKLAHLLKSKILRI